VLWSFCRRISVEETIMLMEYLSTLSSCCSCCAAALQENFFFDGPGRELNSRRVVLRLRFYDTDKKAVLTLKVRLSTYWCDHALLCCWRRVWGLCVCWCY
jgi:uncharacterized protein YjbK